MEGKKQLDSSSSSSFTSDLFGSKEQFGPSSGIFASIFAPSTKVVGRGAWRTEVGEKKQDPASQVWNTKAGTKDLYPQSKEGECQTAPNKDIIGSYYQEEKVQPCHLSSSIYYGGQDIYSRPQNAQSTGYPSFINDGVEDDSGSASRGNWWQGSLYY